MAVVVIVVVVARDTQLVAVAAVELAVEEVHLVLIVGAVKRVGMQLVDSADEELSGNGNHSVVMKLVIVAVGELLSRDEDHGVEMQAVDSKELSMVGGDVAALGRSFFLTVVHPKI